MTGWTKAVLAVVSCTTALLVPGAPAAASCSTTDFAALAARADVAFVGTVTQVRGGAARLVVTDVYAGSPGAQVVVDGDEPTSSVGVGWRTDRQYLVLARSDDGVLSTTDCDGTAEVSDQVLASAQTAFGPATPLGRGAGAQAPDADPGAGPSATPTPTAGADPSPAASEEADTSTPTLAVGLVLAIALAASFFLPQLRRRNRERRRGQGDGETR
ncbi:MAG: hypothetical protein Q7T56_01340 [Nocardioidaceae bacterium]|nr:hypothetical protein [Nocardioidaceae bacterium]